MFLSAHVIIHTSKSECADTYLSWKLSPENFNKYHNFILKILVLLMGVISTHPDRDYHAIFLHILTLIIYDKNILLY